MKIEIFQIDAFAKKLFSGNPAAVCVLSEWLSDELMQHIAEENNLAETAFILAKEGRYEIRWFTPVVEVDLCGHATLASAYTLFEFFETDASSIEFFSPRSGILHVFKEGDILFLDFPTDPIEPVAGIPEIEQGIGKKPMEVYKGKTDYVAVLETEAEVKSVEPNFLRIATLPARGLIVTAKGDTVDFVSRFFAPQSGVNEDHVTGSAHTSLIPLWASKLGKDKLSALQLSKRGGMLTCEYNGERCYIGGGAKLYLKGEVYVEE
ncbi:MAG: PhzF family phenazine biosynthesis protein [Bacteroidota bacterium]